MGKPVWKWLFLLLLVVALFYWKILFTRQFSVLLDYENANQAYAWYHFSAASIKQGQSPLWDPYTFSGRSFVGEMQTGLFYPLKLIVYLWPFNRASLVSPSLFHWFFVLAHVLAAFFMFALARELGLGGYAAFVSSLCFSLAGFVGRVGWPNILDSAIWLPLIFLFLIRALGSDSTAQAVWNACLSGLGMGMAILAGSLHVLMMDIVLVAGVAVYFAVRTPHRAARSALVVLVVGLLAFASGAVQLLPSMEYSGLAVRYIGAGPPLPATEKIAYSDLQDGFWPRALLGFLLGCPFPGGSIGTGEFSPYFGVLPLLLVVIGVWRDWDRPWVRFLAGLAAVSFFYSLGSFSLLHGLVYSLAPFLWMAREAGRFIYLAHFAMAVLAGFGVQALFDAAGDDFFPRLAGVFKWVVIVLAVSLGIPAVYGKPEMNEWAYFSFLFVLGSYGLMLHVGRGNRTRAAEFLLVALIVCDLSAFNWTIRNKNEEQKAGRDHLQVLLSAGNLAAFFKSQPGLFRVQMQGGWQPNIGDLYGVQTTDGKTASVLRDYERFTLAVPRANDLLNVRYFVRPAGADQRTPVYSDGGWKVYENPSYCPRAWVVHRVAAGASPEQVLRRVAEPGFDPLRLAVLSEPLARVGAAAGPDRVSFERYEAGRLELRVQSPGGGLLVLSEVDYPGWRVTVNGGLARIHKVNGLLRGVSVPRGESRVVLRYAPGSVLAGAILSFLAFGGTLIVAVALKASRKAKLGPREQVELSEPSPRAAPPSISDFLPLYHRPRRYSPVPHHR